VNLFAVGYVLAILTTARFVRRPMAEVFLTDTDRDVEDLVIAGLFVLIASVLWPITFLIWWAIPKDKEGRPL
jgi:hypothetical protein